MKLKKVVALLLSLAVMLTSISLLCISASAVEVQTQIDIPEAETTYKLDGVTYTVIRTAAQMNELAVANAGGGVNYILDADLVYSEEVPFTQIHLANGIFNGNGHSITGVNLALSKDSGNNIAMFMMTSNASVTVSNLTVGAPGNPVTVTCTDASWTDNGECRIGTLFGYLQANTVIENVTVYSNVSAIGNFRAGGFIGEARNTLTMKNCVFNGNVTIGTSEGENKNCAAGGLVGHSFKAIMTLENCATYGSVSYKNGFASGLFGAADRYTTFANCVNHANINGKWSGGLIGDAGVVAWTDIKMDNCFNAGKVTGTDGAAGLIYQCARRNDFPTKLTNCANIGQLVCDTDKIADLVLKTNVSSVLTLTNCGSFGTANEFAITNKAAANASATDTTATAAEALSFMQANYGDAMFGIENNRIVVKTVPAEAKFLQYKKDAAADKMDIRVIGVLNTAELGNYTNVGFDVSVYRAGENGAAPVLLKDFDPQTTATVYTSVKANEGNTITEYSAADLGATYLYTLELRNIPMSGSYIFEITAFATETDKTVVRDSGITVMIIDGGIERTGSLKINGTAIYKYEIIYPKNGTLFEEQMARRLQSYLLDKTGVELTVKDDSQVRETEKAFLIGKTKYSTELIRGTLSATQGCVNSTGGDIVAWGNDMTGMVNACKKLTDLLIIHTQNGVLQPAVTVKNAIVVSEKSEFSTMTFNVKTYDQTDARIERVIDVLLRYMPDSIGLQEADATWMRVLENEFSDYYAIVGEPQTGYTDAVPILYSKEKYNLIESGMKWLTSTPDEVSKMDGANYYRIFTWALLEDKATGVRYLHVNTHFDTAGSAIRSAEVEVLLQFLKNYNNVPVVFTGDLNAKRNTNELTLLANFNLAMVFDCSDLTNAKTNANAIDWIYMTPDSVGMTYYTYDDSMYNGDYPSDHPPYYAEFSVTASGKIDHGWKS